MKNIFAFVKIQLDERKITQKTEKMALTTHTPMGRIKISSET
jgi:hypothetical protein